ncbi:MAG: peptide-methionine (S)-S-oxide reductase MsrA [Nitrococcus sp.]|nr:peptide-methionine (S)-S-oxide reductase MsrA [Nitrococcus sp.]
MLSLATLGGGCFWCLDAVYRELRGVEEVVAGYAGGELANPTYQQVCSGHTGHAEVAQIRHDAEHITYRALLEVFFTIHDPTQRDRQGHDIGSQYRSIILYHDEEQRRTAEAVKREITEARLWPRPVVTEIVPLRAFYEAEPQHQDYFARHPDAAYCQVVIAPKVSKLRERFRERLRRGQV